MNLPKRRAIEVILSNKERLLVHDPSVSDLAVFMQALPGLQSLSKAAEVNEKAAEGIMGLPQPMLDKVVDQIAPLFSIMTEITVDEFKQLPMFDGLAIIQALNSLIPKNLTEDQTETGSDGSSSTATDNQTNSPTDTPDTPSTDSSGKSTE